MRSRLKRDGKHHIKAAQPLMMAGLLLALTGLGAAGCSDDSSSAQTDLGGTGGDGAGGTALTYPLNDTWQTACYDNTAGITCPAAGKDYYGQDGQFAGKAAAFKDNGDSTVSDLNTGLTWQQKPTSSSYSWQQAYDYCDSLTLAGKSDWRMPAVKELWSIGNFAKGWPYLDTTYFSTAATPISKDEQYWTTAKYVGVTVEGKSNAAHGVNHATGHIKAYPASTTGPMGKRVRCVRGAVYGINKLKDNGDGTISDEATGLMWSKADSGMGMDWKSALAFAQTRNAAKYLGYSDWRLPDVKELQSIVDYSRSPSATDSAKVGPAIDPLFSCTGITNEAGKADYPYFWTSTSARFSSTGAFYYAWYVAFGMAVNDAGADFHGAGAVRFDTKVKGGPAGEGAERINNYVRLVRGGAVTSSQGGSVQDSGVSATGEGGMPPMGDGGLPPPPPGDGGPPPPPPGDGGPPPPPPGDGGPPPPPMP